LWSNEFRNRTYRIDLAIDPTIPGARQLFNPFGIPFSQLLPIPES
jgi:hypothetical protein